MEEKGHVTWVLTTLEVWSRLWISVVIGRRNFKNIKRLILDTLERGRVEARFLFTADGFEIYQWAVKRLLAGICVYGQVVVEKHFRLDYRLVLESPWRNDSTTVA